MTFSYEKYDLYKILALLRCIRLIIRIILSQFLHLLQTQNNFIFFISSYLLVKVKKIQNFPIPNKMGQSLGQTKQDGTHT